MFLSQAFRLRRSRRRQHTPWAYQMLTLCLMRVRAVLIQIASLLQLDLALALLTMRIVYQSWAEVVARSNQASHR